MVNSCHHAKNQVSIFKRTNIIQKICVNWLINLANEFLILNAVFQKFLMANSCPHAKKSDQNVEKNQSYEIFHRSKFQINIKRVFYNIKNKEIKNVFTNTTNGKGK